MLARSAFTENDLIKFPAVDVVNTQYIELGEYEIVKGELVGLGFGAGDQSGAEGRIFVQLKKADGTELKGKIRLTLTDPQDVQLEPLLFEARTEALSTHIDDRTKQIPFNFNGLLASEGRKYKLLFRADSNGIVDKSKSIVLMDITRKLVR